MHFDLITTLAVRNLQDKVTTIQWRTGLPDKNMDRPESESYGGMGINAKLVKIN